MSHTDKNDFAASAAASQEGQGAGTSSDSDAKLALERDIEQFIRQERASRLRMAVFFTLGVVFFVVVGVLLFSTADQVLKLPIDIEKGEQEVAESTNDPQCRAFIASIEDIGKEYKTYAANLGNILEIDNVSKLQQMADTLNDFRRKLELQKQFYPKANFRFPEASSQLKKWFKYTDNELSILQDLALYQKQEILDKQNRQADHAEETVIVLKKEKDHRVGAQRIKTSKKKPEELLSGALLASQEAFETFRVWHTGGLQPCGAADAGETPWTNINGK